MLTHFLFNLLRIKSLYMFRTLLAHPQDALHKRHFVYCVRMSDGCARIVVSVPPEDEQVMLETCRGTWFSINWMKSVSRWFHYTDILWCTVGNALSMLVFSYSTSYCTKLEVLTSVFMNITVFWDVTPCILLHRSQGFRGTCCFLL
jgi:hypothetical protein